MKGTFLGALITRLITLRGLYWGIKVVGFRVWDCWFRVQDSSLLRGPALMQKPE